VRLPPHPVTGEAGRATKGGFARKSDAEWDLAAFIERAGVTRGHSEGMTVAEWLDQWLDSLHKQSVTTREGYASIVRLHLKPIIGHVRLVDLVEEHIDTAIKIWMAPNYVAAGRTGNRYKAAKGLSNSTVNRILDCLQSALTRAANRRHIAYNPMRAVSKPEEENKEVSVWSAEEAARFLDHPATVEHYLYAAWHLALTTGARRSELCGLRWSDLDLEQGLWRLTRARVQRSSRVVEKKTKNRSSERKVFLDPETIDFLIAHRRRQAVARLKAGPAWEGNGDHVFVDEFGLPIRPDRMSRNWKSLVSRVGAPEVRLHDLRHTSITLGAIDASLPLAVIMARSGHSRVTTSLDYTHIADEVARMASVAIASQIQRHRVGRADSV
jgi:integrase